MNGNRPLRRTTLRLSAWWTMLFTLFALFTAPPPEAPAQAQNPPRETPLASPSPQALACFGFSSAAGDLDGDGFMDLAVSAYREEVNGVTLAGRVYVFKGPDLHFEKVLQQPPPTEQSRFGYSLAFGHIDGDAYADLVVSARKGHPGGVYQAGRVFVYFGPDLDTFVELNEPQYEYNAVFGYDVDTGDVDHDGYDDVAVGARLGDVNGLENAGEVYVFKGPDLSEVIHLVEPVPEADASLGIALSFADLDGDPYADLVVGAIGSEIGGYGNAGEVHVFKGPDLVHAAELHNPQAVGPDAIFGYHLSTGDLNGDGLDDIQVGAPYQQVNGLWRAGAVYTYLSPAWNLEKVIAEPVPQADASFGRALAAGDADGDGYDDLLVAVTYADLPGGWNAGEAYLFFGPDLVQYRHIVLPDYEPADEFGTACFGDLDGDGFADLFIGARQGNYAGLAHAGRGRVYDFATRVPFAEFGHGSPGSAGITPRLAGQGTLQPGTHVQISVDQGLGGAPGFLCFAADLGFTPYKGVEIYALPAFHVQGFVLSGPAGQPGAGAWSLSGQVAPDPNLTGVMFFLQALVQDGGAPQGILAATPGMKLTVQP